MNYSYSARNLLVEPHNYMYAPFEGAPLLDAFFQTRRQLMRRLDSASIPWDEEQVVPIANLIDRSLAQRCPTTHERWRKELADATKLVQKHDAVLYVAGSTVESVAFSVDREVTTTALLEALLAALASEKAVPAQFAQSIPAWLDRLIQRFEVTKRLYDSYQPGFRKGSGDYQSLRRYWLFALILSLSLSKQLRLKNLSALLKACDLLCSVPAGELMQSVPAGGMQIVLATELASIGALIKVKGLPHAA